MDPGERWIRERLDAAPPELTGAMIEAVWAIPSGGLADRFAGAAIRLYQSVVEGSTGRDTALPLLAADALFTHSFQVQAETDVAALPAFVERWSARSSLSRLT
jgi:hypothetical protein